MPIQSMPPFSPIGAAPAALFSAPLTGSLSQRSPSQGSKDTPEKIQKAAMDFEALLIAQMLKSARESGGGVTGDADEQDETNSTLLELGEQQLAQALSNSGGLGIAKMVVVGLTNHANR
jgi:Rod binding domain-containing protein